MQFFHACFPSDLKSILPPQHRSALDAFFVERGLSVRHDEEQLIRVATAGPCFQPKILEVPRNIGRWRGGVLIGELSIYNTAEIAAWLRSRNLPVAQDVHNLLCAFLMEADEFAISQVIGDFAILLFRPDRVTLYRDHFGVRQLFWSKIDDVIHISNCAGALHPVPGQTARLSRRILARHLILGLPGAGATHYDNIFSVPPASAVTFGASSNPVVHRYWKPRPANHLAGLNPDERLDAFDAEVKRAIHVRLCSPAAHLAFELSGGLDSSTIAGIAAASAEERFDCVTCVLPKSYKGDAWDELTYVKSVIRNHPNLSLLEADGAAHPLLAGAYEVPLWHRMASQDYSTAYLWQMHQQLATKGRRYALGGLGGDHCISAWGISYLNECILKLKLKSALEEARRVGKHRGEDPARILLIALRHVLVPRPLRRFKWWIQRYRNLEEGVLRREAADELAIFDDLYSNELMPGLQVPRSISEEMRMNIELALAKDIFCYAEFMSYESGIVRRMPFLDWRLVELCMAMPSDDYVQGQRNRIPLRRLAGRYASQEVAERTVKGFFAPGILDRFSAERELLAELLTSVSNNPLWCDLVDKNKLLTPPRGGMETGDDYGTLIYRSLIPCQVAALIAIDERMRA